MIILALSSSGPLPSAALCENGKVSGYIQGESGHTHSETLMPLAEALLAEKDISTDKIDIFSADIGPGSFTGVRIGVCAVNAMASVFHKGLVGINALEALCYGHSGNVCALIDARNESAYAALFKDGEYLRQPEAAAIYDYLENIEDGTLFVGDGALAYKDIILSRVKNAAFASGELRADNVAMLAWKHLQYEKAQPEILPMYLRPSQAERLFKEKSEKK